MSEEKNSKYLAILFFNQNNGRGPELPGVGRDKEKLTELLRNYVQITVDDSMDILEDLQVIVEESIGEEFERVHFHFSGKICDLTRIHINLKKNLSHSLSICDNIFILYFTRTILSISGEQFLTSLLSGGF